MIMTLIRALSSYGQGDLQSILGAWLIVIDVVMYVVPHLLAFSSSL